MVEHTYPPPRLFARLIEGLAIVAPTGVMATLKGSDQYQAGSPTQPCSHTVLLPRRTILSPPRVGFRREDHDILRGFPTRGNGPLSPHGRTRRPTFSAQTELETRTKAGVTRKVSPEPALRQRVDIAAESESVLRCTRHIHILRLGATRASISSSAAISQQRRNTSLV